MSEQNSPQTGFLVDIDEARIVLVAEQNGQEYRLAHILRQPTSSEWKEFDRKLSKIISRGRKVTTENSPLQAKEWLYNLLIQRVEGYLSSAGKELQDISGWKEKIPVTHKQQVVDYFDRVYVQEGDAEKN